MKNGEGSCEPSPFLLLKLLEAEARAELYPAGTGVTVGGNKLCCDHSEVSRVLGVQSGIQEVDMVERVEEIRRELELHAFMEGCDLPDAPVEIPQTKPAQRVISAVPRIA